MIDFETTTGDYYLSLNGLQLDEVQKDHVLELTFQEKLGSNSTVRIRIQDGEDLELTFDQVKLDATVELEMGWTGEIVQVFTGQIIDVTPDFTEEGVPFLDITAQDLSCIMKKPQAPHFDYGDNMLEVVRAIHKPYGNQGLGLTIDPEQTLKDWKLSDEEEVSRQAETDLQMLTWIAKRSGYQLYCRDNALYFVEKDYWFKQQGTDIYRLYYAPTLDDLDDPRGINLRRFRPGVKSAGMRTRVEVQAWSSVDTRGVKRGTATLDQSAKSERDFTQIKVKTDEIITLKVYGQVAESAAAAKTIAQAEIDRRESDLVIGQGRVKGWAPLRIGQKHDFFLRAFKSFGRTFSGRYQLSAVEHKIDDTGFWTEFDVSRGSLNEDDSP